MNLLRRLAPLALLTVLTTAHAQTQALVVTDAPKAPATTLNLQSSQGSSCATIAVGNCGTCSISCQPGQAAMCKPGISVNASKGSASCVTPPECKCQ